MWPKELISPSNDRQELAITSQTRITTTFYATTKISSDLTTEFDDISPTDSSIQSNKMYADFSTDFDVTTKITDIVMDSSNMKRVLQVGLFCSILTLLLIVNYCFKKWMKNEQVTSNNHTTPQNGTE